MMIKLIAATGIISIPLLAGCINVPKVNPKADANNTREMSVAPSLGRVLTTSEGMTLYTYDPDKGATCSEGCSLWPPYGYARNDAPSESATEKKMVLQIYDELKIWTINGSPLHTFVLVKKPGDTQSDGLGGWYIAREPQPTVENK